MVKSRPSIYLITLSFVFVFTKLLAFNDKDSTKTAKLPQHYFNKTIYLDTYSAGKRTLDTVNMISRRLKTFQVSQFSMGFNIPVVTKNFYNKDSTRISNFHFLLTGAYTKIDLNFGGISTHQLSKTSVGFRGLYNNGKKSILFYEISPFVNRDNGFSYTRVYRLATTFLFNYAASEKFSFRVGFTRSYLWGNRYNLPYIGLRFGRLDKVNFSIQFPRGMTFCFPMGHYVRATIYTKPQGGLYSFANTDSIQVGNFNDNKQLFFGRSEFLSGWRIDVLPSKKFNAYLSSGFTTQNFISFSSTATARSKYTAYNNYYKQSIKGSVFINIGLVIRLGKTRSYYNNIGIYNAIDMNNDMGENGINLGNGNIPVAPRKKIKINNPNEVLDLIETQDLY